MSATTADPVSSNNNISEINNNNANINTNNFIASQKIVAEHLRRTHSTPIPPIFNNNNNDLILVKVIFPSLDCSKILRLNPNSVNYDPLVRILTIAKACF